MTLFSQQRHISRSGTFIGSLIAMGSLSITALGLGTAHAESGTMPQLDTSTYAGQVFWLVISFGVLFVIMWKVALPRVSEVIEAREHKIASDLDKAEQNSTEIATIQQEIDEAIATARHESEVQMRAIVETATQERAKKLAKLDSKLAAQTEQAEAQIKAAEAQAIASLDDVVTDAAKDILQQLAGIKASAADIKKALS